MPLSEKLVQKMACPKCKGKLILTEAQDFFICEPCKLKYPIIDEIPRMLIDKALPLEEKDKESK